MTETFVVWEWEGPAQVSNTGKITELMCESAKSDKQEKLDRA